MPSIDLSRYERKKTVPASPKAASNSFQNLMSRDISFGSRELSDKKKEYLYLELSSLLRAGIDLKNSIELITSGQETEKDRQLFQAIQDRVLKGIPLSEALRQSEKFSLYEVFSLEIGEETAQLTEVLEDLARFYQNKIQQRRKVVSALTYPCIVLSTSVGAVFFMLKFVVPMFSDVFTRFGGELPWITKQILDLSKVVQNAFLPFLIVATILGGLLWYFRNSARFRKTTAEVILRIPVVGNLVKKVYLARFCNSMRLLLSAHIPLLRAIMLSRKMIGYYPIESSLGQVENDILKGRSLHESLRDFKIYPAKLIMQLKIAEEGNKLDVFFGRLSEQYLKEVEYQTTTLNSVMQPVFTLLLGLIVGIIMVAMYLPMFQMSNTFQ
ncbi:type II secretion system F family protein [Mucilaginibacter sabulilitoris]|uniref:General secretion pathway protein F n=1 Tax=Mucilaginibacter sabulilitoris TaxID=1173583 RepID=A0ABZ0TSA7_9SPHI|nr:type II secretion system F family protein [Mucilaginibacter sabulilitoris]WPU95851.1 type II secretion system F family protein [Mucilaginibacter sabulilitoris]